ncbi:cysteine proteinase [Ceratobasidium sp. AG-I]|nr:cysteine proteinase [Ceratobasidium sp. AG-I]
MLKRRGTVARVAEEQLSDEDLACLNPTQSLNHNIINFYGALLMARCEQEERDDLKTPDIHYFRTSFFAKLEALGYEKARLGNRTKKIDIFEKDVLLIPVGLENADWACAAIYLKQKRIEYYDSMGRQHSNVHACLRDYLEKEHLDKKKTSFDWAGWEYIFDKKTPRQENHHDCGVFSCQYMECISRGAGSDFGGSKVVHLRQRMILEIERAKLWDRW